MNATIDGARRRSDWSDDHQGEPPAADPAALQRAERTAAQQRYEAFLSSGPGETSAPGDSGPAGCDPDPSAPAVAFRKENGDADEVDLHDVKQGSIGDCYLMVSLAGLTRTPEGRALIRNAIVENKNDAGQVVSYTVTLHKPEPHGWFAPTTFAEVRVTVDGSFGCGHALARLGDHASFQETWPLLIEQAYAQCFGGYDTIGQGGTAAGALQVLTGREAEHIVLDMLTSYSETRLARQVASGQIVVLGTKRGEHPQGVVGNHAYLVTGTVVQGGKLYLDLHNPWDRDDLHVAYDDIEDSLAFVDVAAAR
jgi:hypothetical protein